LDGNSGVLAIEGLENTPLEDVLISLDLRLLDPNHLAYKLQRSLAEETFLHPTLVDIIYNRLVFLWF
jgi:hypothetical protein